MGEIFQISDRLNWQQACTILGCKKSAFYRLVGSGEIIAYGIGARYRWYSKKECQDFFDKNKDLTDE